jgi:SPP1 family predicted phage head-tail adaptor
MRAGLLNRRLKIERPQVVKNSVGEEITTWQDYATVWASIEPIRGNEALRAGQVLAEMDTRIKIRWSEGVKNIEENWRLSHEGIIYNIVSIANINTANKELEIMCNSGVNNG